MNHHFVTIKLTGYKMTEGHILDLSPSEVLNLSKDRVIANATAGRGINISQYFQDVDILDAKGILEQDPDLHRAIVQSGQNPLVWQGVYMRAKESVNALQIPHASVFARQAALQGLRACFRIAEITRMDVAPNYSVPTVQQKVYPVWETTWAALNSWRPLLQEPQEEVIPPIPPPAEPEPPTAPTAPEEAAPEPNDAHALLTELRQVHQRMKNPAGADETPEEFWRLRELEDQLQLQLSQILGLSTDESPISWQESLRELAKMRPYLIGNDDPQLYKLISPEQIELAWELFAQAPQVLKKTFDEYQKERTGDNLMRLQDLIKQMASEAFFGSAKKRAEDARGKRYLTLLEQILKQTDAKFLFAELLKKESPPSDDELIKAFIKKNQAERDTMEVEKLELISIHQFMTDLAQKAGLKFVNKGDGRFELVRKNTPPPQKTPASA